MEHPEEQETMIYNAVIRKRRDGSLPPSNVNVEPEKFAASIELDHLAKLAEDRWREHENSSQAEWRLSYGVWGALLAAMGSLLMRNNGLPPWVAAYAARLVVCAIGAHAFGLFWIQWRLSVLRIEMNAILARRRQLLNLPAMSGQSDLSWIAAAGQVLITVLLCAVLLAVVMLQQGSQQGLG